MSEVSRTYSEAIERIRDAIERASATGRRNMNAMSLATVDGAGSPSVRHVLLKSIDDEGLRFFTDARSEKAQNLAGNPRASVCFYWEPIEEQARVDGTVVRLSDEEVAADFAARPRAGQVMIQVSAQSQPLDSLEALRAARDEADARLPDPIPRPADWIGFRLEPDRIEHWQGSRDRVHTRTVVTRVEGAWNEALLQP